MAFINTVTSVGDAALTESIITRSITELADDKITSLGKDALRGCRKLTKVDFPNLDSIGTSALQDCTKLETVILRKHLMCSLGANGLNGTPIANGAGYVYVPKTVIDVYKGSASWSALVNQIRAYEDYAYLFSNAGKVWVQSNVTENMEYEFVRGNTLWVAVRNDRCYYSTDGRIWANKSMPFRGRSLCTDGNLFVSGGYNTGLYYSTDGQTWTQSNITTNSFEQRGCIAYANGQWVALAYSNSAAYYSADGMTWTPANTSVSAAKNAVWGNNVWVAGSYKNGIWYSTDGVTWTQSNVTGATTTGIFFANGLFAAATESTIYYSTDAKTWTQSLYGSASTAYLSCANNMWIATSNGQVHYSTDAKTWVSIGVAASTGVNMDATRMAYGGLWVFGTRTGIYFSADGNTWTQSDGVTSQVYGIEYANGVFVAATNKGIYYSDHTV